LGTTKKEEVGKNLSENRKIPVFMMESWSYSSETQGLDTKLMI
jgi:hypothetical protein